MENFLQKLEFIKSFIILLFSSIFGKFWFLFIFLMILNVLDTITGVMKARFFKIESSKASFKGICKKTFMWFLIAISFGLSLALVRIGEILNMEVGFLVFIGWGVVSHCIINECRSIIENIIEIDPNSKIVPHWLVKGLSVYQKVIEKQMELDTTENIINEVEGNPSIKKKKERGFDNCEKSNDSN